jgi:ribonuclease HI
MMAKSKKIYAVFQGHQPGLYLSWEEASNQVKGFHGAKYKSFFSQEEAIGWLRQCVISATEPVSEQLITLIKSTDLPEDDSMGTGQRIIIHTDGGASPNPGVGGYGVVLQQGRLRKELSAGYELTTNNRMEMMAVIVALEALKEPSTVVLHTDSKYVVDSISKRWVYGWMKRGWKKSDGKMAVNVDLWQRLLPLLKTHKVEFKWVKGHAGNTENERCDTLVNEAKNLKTLLKDTGYK